MNPIAKKKAPFSAYLTGIAPMLKALVADLGGTYDYVSVLATDSPGLMLSISRSAREVRHANMTTERGCVVRVRKDGLYSEYAFNGPLPEDAAQLADTIRAALDAQLAVLAASGAVPYETGILPDEPLTLFVEKEAAILPEEMDIGQAVQTCDDLAGATLEKMPHGADCRIRLQSTHISKLFLTAHRDLRQSYVYAEGMVLALTARDGKTCYATQAVSGLGGAEIFDGLREAAEKAADLAGKMLDAKRIEPGEYDIITTPGISGLIAHEAFGHGVEMDMFVKNRALGASYIGKRVGSDLVTMHEGAACAESTAAYAFDDEGIPAGDVTEIDRGILKTGICDALSALRLGTVPTGNGKRENYAHKVYTRMTNTVFDAGEDTLEEMIASIGHGYILEGTESGMEDPKHWGIQCIISRGYEIRDGKLTGVIVSPVVMTGYVPELLGSISMAGKDVGIEGNGGCGKGYKEWVKVADGGPYLKARGRLG